MPAYNTYKSTMKKNTFLILSLLLLYLYPLSASVEIRSNKLTTGDGLANNSTRYMMQDSKGFIWLGTLNGLSYYDGNSFVNIYPDINNPLSLADSRIRSMEEDPNGFMWISTISSFISCYDLRHGCFVDFTGNGEYKENYSKFIILSDNSIWLWRPATTIHSFPSFTARRASTRMPRTTRSHTATMCQESCRKRRSPPR